MLGRVSVSLRCTASRIRLRTSTGRWSGPTERDEMSYQAIPASTPTVGHVATDEPIAVAFATGGRGEHRGAQVDARALLLESSDKLTPELRHDVLPRQSKHAEHLGEIDLTYATRKQALALDEQFHGDALPINHFAKLEGAVGGALRIVLSRGATHASPRLGRPAWLVERLSGMVGGMTSSRVGCAFCGPSRPLRTPFWTASSSTSTLGRRWADRENSTWTRHSWPCAKNFGATGTRGPRSTGF